MPIHSHCPACKGRSSLQANKCSKCGQRLPRPRQYRVEVCHNRRRVTKVVTSLQLARELEASLKADLIKGEAGMARKPGVPTLGEVWQRYLVWAKENKKSWENDLRYYRTHIEHRFARKRLDEITAFDLEKMKVEMKRSLNRNGRPFAPATIRHQLAIIRRLYNLARAWGLYSGPSPLEQVTLPKVDNELVRYLTPEQTTRFWQVLEHWPCPQTAALVKVAMLTGMRRGELFRLRWEDIDFHQGVITLVAPKGGKTTAVPVCPEVIEILRQLPVTSEFVFPGRGGKMRTCFNAPWRRIRQAAGLPKEFRFHDLRHHFAVSLVSSGQPLEVVQALLTHKSPLITKRYAHLIPGVVKQAAESAAAAVGVSHGIS